MEREFPNLIYARYLFKGFIPIFYRKSAIDFSLSRFLKILTELDYRGDIRVLSTTYNSLPAEI